MCVSRQARHRRSLAPGWLSPENKALIRQMAKANTSWGAPRIHGELLKLGIDSGERSVSRFMPPSARKPPSQTRRTFLDNQTGSLCVKDAPEPRAVHPPTMEVGGLHHRYERRAADRD